MSEATLIKPRPGPRGKEQAQPHNIKKDQGFPADQTVVMTKIKAGCKASTFPPLRDNPLVEEAAELLSVIGQIRSTSHHKDVSSLQKSCIDKVREYEERLRNLFIDSKKIKEARYCLCSFLDETVLNTAWGGQSIWSTESLLSTFHAETFGGEYFYTLMESSLVEPRTNIQLLELQYVCLSLGFVGKMRVEERGMEKLENYREQAYQLLIECNGELTDELSPDSKNYVLNRQEVKSAAPLWVFVSIFALLILAIYMGLNNKLNNYSNRLFNELNDLVPIERKESQLMNTSVNPAFLRLQQLLQREVENGVLEITELSDRVRVIIKSSELFLSGSADVQAALTPILSKIARALESTTGKILITGHTDNQPIFTSKYPSNWHLSLARATAVANSMAMGTDLHGRLWPEGGGESSPRNANDSEQGRARNRRVEIDLLL